MTQNNQELLRYAIRLARAGNKRDAQHLLKAVLKKDPHDQTAWLWYIGTLATEDDQIEWLKQFLELYPNHRPAQLRLQSLQKLRQERGKITAPQQSSVDFSYTRPASTVKQTGQPMVASAKKQNEAQLLPVWPYIALAIIGALTFSLLMGLNNLALHKLESLRNDYNSLVDDYNELLASYKILYQDHVTLQVNQTILSQEHFNLVAEYASLNTNYSTLQVNYDTLTQEFSSLQTDYNSLVVAYDALGQEYTDYRSTSIAPPYIYVSQRQVIIAYVATDQTIKYWNVPFESLETSIEKGDLFRTFPDRITLDNDNGDKYKVIDFRPFVKPDTFTDVIPAVYYTTNSDEEFIYEVWNIVTQLALYSSDIGETPRLPLETFLAGGGDCEDTAILFASMIMAAPVNWDVYLVYMDADHPQDPETTNHVIVSIDTGNDHYLIETTEDFIMEPYDTVNGWYLKVER